MNEKAKIIDIVTSNPIHLSQLLNRNLPETLNDACAKQNIHIFPHTWDDVEGSCSCPDWAVPCKHMAAVLYLVANEIDKNPFLVFELHSFDLFKGLEGVGYTSEDQQEVSILSTDDLRQPFSVSKPPLEWDEAAYNNVDFSTLPECRNDLLAILTEKPVFYPAGDFKKVLDKTYKNVTRSLRKTKKRSTESTDTYRCG